MKNLTKKFLKEQEGVTAIEYGLIAGLIVAVIATTVQSIGTKLDALFQTIAGYL